MSKTDKAKQNLAKYGLRVTIKVVKTQQQALQSSCGHTGCSCAK